MTDLDKEISATLFERSPSRKAVVEMIAGRCKTSSDMTFNLYLVFEEDVRALGEAAHRMVDNNPDLSSKEDVDHSLLRQVFVDLWKVRPDLAKNPTIAGAIVRQCLASPATAGVCLLKLMK